MLIELLMFAAGLGLLVLGAELLVRGASRLALSFGLSPLVVGLTIVAFGTSAPELAVSVGAALEGRGSLAVGNLVGSNILNVLFILGLSALIVPLAVHGQLIRQEMPVMIGAALLLLGFSRDGLIVRGEAALLFLLLLGYTAFLIWQSRCRTSTAAADPPPTRPTAASGQHWAAQAGLVIAGLAGLVLGSHWLVGAATVFARALGVSDAVIGLTIVAAGTSLPEAAASVAAALKGQRDMAVGNVVGSNVFNILGGVGLAGLASGAAGLQLPAALLQFDLWVMLAALVVCLPVFLSGREIGRWEGLVLLGHYALYVGYLVLQARQHSGLPGPATALTGLVLSLGLFTLAVSLLQPGRPR